MNAREGIAYGIGILGLLGAGYFAAQAGYANDRVHDLEKQARTLPSLQAKAEQAGKDLAAARTEGERLKAEAVQAVEERKVLEAKVAELAAGMKPAPPVPAPAATPKKKGSMGEMMKMSRKMMDSPAMKEQMRKTMGQLVEENYADLFQELGLSPDLRDKVTQALIDRMIAQQEMGMLLLDEELSPEEVLRRQAEMEGRQKGALGALLGNQATRLEAYDKTIPDRMQARTVDKDLQSLHLQPTQQAQVRSIVLEEQKDLQTGLRSMGGGVCRSQAMTAEDIRKAREMMGQGSGAGQQDLEALVKSMAESRERTLARVQPLLSPEQFEAFKKQQDAKVQMMEMGLKMMQSMGE